MFVLRVLEDPFLCIMVGCFGFSVKKRLAMNLREVIGSFDSVFTDVVVSVYIYAYDGEGFLEGFDFWCMVALSFG